MGKQGVLLRWIYWAVVITALFFIGFIIGWFAKPSQPRTEHHKESSRFLKEFLEEMKAQNIRQHLRKFTRLPHLAGTEQNLKYAEQIQEEWQSFGLDTVDLVHYDVLLSYPDKTQPNYISIVDALGNEIFNTSLEEPVPEGYENISDIVPPYSAFSPKGQPEGSIVKFIIITVMSYEMASIIITCSLCVFF